jgi:hypothetical protein
MFMKIEPEEVIPHLLPVNLSHTFDLLTMGSATATHVSMFVSFKSCNIVSTFQCPSPFLLEDTRLLLKKPSSSHLPILLLVGPVQVWLRYLVTLQTPLSPECMSYSAIRLMEFYTKIAYSVGCLCSLSLQRS